jgi:hypothetical protein
VRKPEEAFTTDLRFKTPPEEFCTTGDGGSSISCTCTPLCRPTVGTFNVVLSMMRSQVMMNVCTWYSSSSSTYSYVPFLKNHLVPVLLYVRTTTSGVPTCTVLFFFRMKKRLWMDHSFHNGGSHSTISGGGRQFFVQKLLTSTVKLPNQKR